MLSGPSRRPGKRPAPPGPVGGDGDGEADWISGLPDDLLHLVLVRLECTREAARTSILARRWRSLWTRLPEHAFWDMEPKEVETVLAQVTRPALDRLDIDLELEPESALDCASSLLRAAARLSPETVCISLYNPVEEDAALELPCPWRERASSSKYGLHQLPHPRNTPRALGAATGRRVQQARDPPTRHGQQHLPWPAALLPTPPRSRDPCLPRAQGDHCSLGDASRARDASVMVARGAMWNASIFCSKGKTPWEDVRKEYVRKSILWDNDIKSTKHTLKEMIMHHSCLELPEGKALYKCDTSADVARLYGEEDYYNFVISNRK